MEIADTPLFFYYTETCPLQAAERKPIGILENYDLTRQTTMNYKPLILFAAFFLASGCAMDTTKTDTAEIALTKSSYPGTYSLYGKSVYRDNDSGLMCIDVYVGGGGNRDGAQHFAGTEIQKYAHAHNHSSYEIVKSEYTFFPLSKYTFYVKYQ